jgi:hypothetical protein
MDTFATRTMARSLREKSRVVRANAEAIRKKAYDLNVIAMELVRERVGMSANLRPAPPVRDREG